MKIATVSLLTIIGGNLSARPAVLKTDENGGESASTTGCDDKWAKDVMDNWCADAGRKPIHTFTDDGWLWDTTFECTGTCCGGALGGPGSNGKCKCIHAGNPHGGSSSWTWNCCSMTSSPMGHVADAPWTGNNKTHCGCAYLGDKLHHSDARETDCCSKKWHSSNNRTCIQRECTHKGDVGEGCCGYITEDGGHTANTMADGTCKCIPHGYDLDFLQLGQASDCCSGAVIAGTSTCGCIDQFEDPLPPGASADDCCSRQTETNDRGVFCKAHSCSTKGQSAAGGAYCCSGKSGSNLGSDDSCLCLPGGQEIPDGETNECCMTTGHGTNLGKCGFAYPGVGGSPYNPDKAGQCASGIIGANDKCTCIRAGVQPRDEQISSAFCCSDKFDANSRNCSCVENGNLLQVGADEKDCCSRTAAHGSCKCAFPGRPAWSEDSTGAECCSGYQTGGYCGCNVAGKPNQPPGSCCGGFKNSTTDTCVCIPDGTRVAPFVRPEACCSGSINHDTCGRSAHVSGAHVSGVPHLS